MPFISISRSKYILKNLFLQVQENVDDATKTLENAILSLKILEKLTVHGFKRPNDSRHVNLFIKLVFERAKAVLSICKYFFKDLFLLNIRCL